MVRRTTWTAAAGWATLAAVACLALGGAAARPKGILLGVPGAAGLLLIFIVLTFAFAWRPVSAAATPGLGLLAPLLLLLSGLLLPGVRAVSGPPLFALVLAVLAVILSQVAPRLPRSVFLPAVFLLYAGIAARAQLQVGPQGDEPQYLMVADSLWHEGNVSPEKGFSEGRYLAFHDGPLAPHYRVRGKDGRIYSLHAVGLSLLIVPAYALGGYPAASLFMAFLTALLAWQIRELLRTGSGSDQLAEGMAWVIALSPPLIHYAGLIFTEVPAALLLATVLRLAHEGKGWKFQTALGLGIAVAFLPWLNIRYAPLALILLAYGLWTRPERSRTLAFAVPSLVSWVGIAAYHSVLYGFFDPRRVYGRRPELALTNVPEGLPGLLLDQEFGLLVYAPVFVLALPGFWSHWRKDRRQSVTSIALVGAVLLTAAAWPMWRGGYNPPARFLVPVVPILALLAGLAVQRGLGAGGALLVGWSLWTGLLGGWEPRLVHRDRDDTAPLFRAYSGAEEWTRLLPGYVLADPDRYRLSLVWGAGLVLAVSRRRSAVTGAQVAVASLGLIAAAGIASSLSQARVGGRDAVRLLGRRALEVPGWGWAGPAARWGPSDLAWGPLYEPHRHPEGAELGSRLALPAGRYRIVVEAENLAPTQSSPVLVARLDVPGAPERVWPLAPVLPGWTGVFEVPPGAAVTLLVRGGGPFVLHALSLEPQPSTPDPV
jgi:hypothetical protein